MRNGAALGTVSCPADRLLRFRPFDDEMDVESRHKEDIRREIARNGLRPSLGPLLGSSAPEALRQLALLVQMCWSTDPDARPEFALLVPKLIKIAADFGYSSPIASFPAVVAEQKPSTDSSQIVKTWRIASTVALTKEAGTVTALLQRPGHSEVWIGLSTSEIRILGALQFFACPRKFDQIFT